MITGEQLLGVFADYNLQIWPMQIVAYILGLIALYFGFQKTILASRINSTILAFFWLWVALLFWLPSARQGFTIGYAFFVLFLVEGVLFLIQAVKPKLSFGTYNKSDTIGGLIMILYAMFGYPLLGLLIGHRYPHTPPFGLTPCPLIIFTLGLLLLTRSVVPSLLLVIPFFYALSGVIWVSIGIWEDVGMVLGSLVSIVLILQRNKKLKAEEQIKNREKSSETWSLNVGD